MTKKLVTHSEDFHTDDVFATALLLEIFPDATVTRSRDEAVINSGDIVYDVGKIYDPGQGRFDHHQEGAAKRENGITYSSFGLLWKEYGQQFCDGDKAVADTIDKRLVMPVDANDNGQSITESKYGSVQPFTVDTLIKMANPLLNGDEDYDAEFHKAVDWAGQVLRRLRASVADDLKSQTTLRMAYDQAADNRVVAVETAVSIKNYVEDYPELLYLISPRPNGTWSVLAVPDGNGSLTPKRPFPEAWRAQPAEVLRDLSGVDDSIFCHATGFLFVTASRQGAEALASRALKEAA